MALDKVSTDSIPVLLYMALELSAKTWRLAFSAGGRVRQTTIDSGDEKALRAKIEVARKRFGLPETTTVVSCYEAGRDGFWVHRFLTKLGIESVVVDAASMKVDRRSRRKKNDRIDAQQLVLDLIRHHRGERDIWSVVRVPSQEQEDIRRLHRDLQRLKKEQTQHQVRIRSLLATQGIRAQSLTTFLRHLDEARTWDGKPIPPMLRSEIERERERLELVKSQRREIEKERERRLENPSSPSLKKIERLATLRGVGVDSAWFLVMELFGWREFRNRREVGGAVGLGGTPYSSGDTEREQGISKAGNPRVRARMVELAWQWLRYQPQSDLSQWFGIRFAAGGPRVRRVGIVALARRLLVDLWHFVDHGVMPRRAVLKRIPVVTK